MNQKARDEQWAKLNSASIECSVSGNYSQYRDIRYRMFLLQLYEKRYLDSFGMLSEVFLFDLNGDKVPYESEGIIRCARNLFPTLNLDCKDLKDIIINRLKDIYTPYRIFKINEVVDIFLLFASGNSDAANVIFYRNIASRSEFLRYQAKILKDSIEMQDKQRNQVQKKENQYKSNGDLDEYVTFFEKVWATGGLKFYSMKWWFVLPDLYFKQKRYEEVIDFCEMIQFLDEYTIDKAGKYIQRAQQRKEKLQVKNNRTNT